MRGRGWGAKLFQSLLDHFKRHNTRLVGLDAVETQVGTYGRRGFVETDRIKVMVRKSLQELALEGGLEHVQELNERCTDLGHVPSRILAESDFQHAGFNRPQLWSLLLNRDDVSGFALVKEVGAVEPELEGWIVVRRSIGGWRLGPLYATTRRHAEFLLKTAMKRLEAEEGNLVVEVWGSNSAAVKIFEDAGWTHALDYHRMWIDGRVPDAQKPGGKASSDMFATYDASTG